MNFLKAMSAGIVQAAETFLIRTGLKIAGTAAITWLLAKGVDPTQAHNFVGYVMGAVITGAGIWASRSNTATATAKSVAAIAAGFDHAQAITIQKAQEQGVTIQAATDQERVNAVSRAIMVADADAPKTKAALLAQLAGGK